MTTTVDSPIGSNDTIEWVFSYRTEVKLWGCQIKTIGRLLQYSEATLMTTHPCITRNDVDEIVAALADHGLQLVQPQRKN